MLFTCFAWCVLHHPIAFSAGCPSAQHQELYFLFAIVGVVRPALRDSLHPEQCFGFAIFIPLPSPTIVTTTLNAQVRVIVVSDYRFVTVTTNRPIPSFFWFRNQRQQRRKNFTVSHLCSLYRQAPVGRA